jgi:hypothetical protein
MSMNIKELTTYVEFMLPSRHTLCLESNPAMGKSTVVFNSLRKAIARRMKCSSEEVMVVDKRGSQMEGSDLVGGQWMVGGQTFNAPPSWVPVRQDDSQWLGEHLRKAGYSWEPFTNAKVGILFLDELLHANKMVLAAFFEILNDHAVHGIHLPDEWFVICAMNGDLDRYDGTRMSPALLSRLIMIKFEPSHEEYLEYLAERVKSGEIHGIIPAFLHLNKHLIDPDNNLIDEATAEGVKTFDRRSWDRLGESLILGCQNGMDLIDKTVKTQEGLFLQKVTEGYVGPATAGVFVTFVRDEFGTLGVEEILYRFTATTEDKIKALGLRNPAAMGGLNTQVVERLAEHKGKLTPEIEKNILGYFKSLPREAASAFWKLWSSHSNKTRAQSLAWHVTPVRQSAVLLSIVNDKAHAQWVATNLSKYPGFSTESDEPYELAETK